MSEEPVVYFSRREKEKELVIQVYGKGALLLENVRQELDHALGFGTRFPKRIELIISGDKDEKISVDAAFLERLNTLKVLRFEHVKEMPMIPKFKENNLLVIGKFDSQAEQFALENDLHFRPQGLMCFAGWYDTGRQIDRIASLEFSDDGRLLVQEHCHSNGSRPGPGANYDLGRDIQSITVEQIARRLDSDLYTSAVKSDELAEFLSKAKTHKMYFEEAK